MKYENYLFFHLFFENNYKSSTKEQLNVITQHFESAIHEDSKLAIQTLLWVRDIRYGIGLRDVFRHLLLHMETNHPSLLETILLSVPHYGRWDDLFIFNKKETLVNVCDIVVDYLQFGGFACNLLDEFSTEQLHSIFDNESYAQRLNLMGINTGDDNNTIKAKLNAYITVSCLITKWLPRERKLGKFNGNVLNTKHNQLKKRSNAFIKLLCERSWNITLKEYRGILKAFKRRYSDSMQVIDTMTPINDKNPTGCLLRTFKRHYDTVHSRSNSVVFDNMLYSGFNTVMTQAFGTEMYVGYEKFLEVVDSERYNIL